MFFHLTSMNLTQLRLSTFNKTSSPKSMRALTSILSFRSTEKIMSWILKCFIMITMIMWRGLSRSWWSCTMKASYWVLLRIGEIWCTYSWLRLYRFRCCCWFVYRLCGIFGFRWREGRWGRLRCCQGSWRFWRRIMGSWILIIFRWRVERRRSCLRLFRSWLPLVASSKIPSPTNKTKSPSCTLQKPTSSTRATNESRAPA